MTRRAERRDWSLCMSPIRLCGRPTTGGGDGAFVAVCDNGERRPARRPYVGERGHRVAVVTGVPVEECPACGEIWLDEPVALCLDGLLTEMLATETVAVCPFPGVESTAA